MTVYEGFSVKQNHGHYEIYQDNKLICTADTYGEAMAEIDVLIEEEYKERR